ncbi:hypothetical protein HYALB_00003284 [Hymenoscyphus albidus]|uniref:Uncharacterized protein n=1 Tax=Hymenoscyphus albidus TaxID=595503 RepID=A0A9N9LD74_9HELO|nr:hypothetical protein HYALB_00003284 [Hymenoscyphus albidus]
MFRGLLSAKHINRVDLLGTALLLGAGIFAITAVQQVEVHGNWSSALTISLLVLSGPLFALFLWRERCVTRASEESDTEPVFPWRFVENRVWMAMIMNTFFVGTVFTTLIIQIPLRLQAAGVYLLPYGLLAPPGGLFCNWLMGKKNLPPIVVFFTGASIQTVAVALLSILPTTEHFWMPSLGYEVMAGFGTGMNLGGLLMVAPYVCEERDLSVGSAAINQFRFLGGSFGLAIVSSVMYSYTRGKYEDFLPPEIIKALLESLTVVENLQPAVRERVRQVLAEGYNLQMKILIGFAMLQIVTTVLMWEKKVRRIKG